MASRAGVAVQPIAPCGLASTLGALDRLAWENPALSGDIYRRSSCAYSLGRGLFLDLYDALEDEAFRRVPAALPGDAGRGPRGGVRGRRAWRAGRAAQQPNQAPVHEAVCAGVERGACYLRRAFVGEAPPDSAALAAPIIDRWYGTPAE